jgi:hypothetical protein
MNDLDKAIWQASRGDKPQFIALLTKLFDDIDWLRATIDRFIESPQVMELEKRVEALESRRGPGRPKGS